MIPTDELREALKDPVIQYFDDAPSECKPIILKAAQTLLSISGTLEEIKEISRQYNEAYTIYPEDAESALRNLLEQADKIAEILK